MMTFGIGILVGVVIAGFLFKEWCGVPLGFSIWVKKEVSSGYVLVSPYFSGVNFDKSGEIDLVDTAGTVVHSWKTKYPVLMSYLQPSGHLYAAMTPPIDSRDFPSPGSSGLVQELDWEGDVVWEYADRDMTHDFEIMPDGGIAYIRWHEAPAAFADGVRGGMPVPGADDVWLNEIVVVNREKDIVWTWRPDEHLDPRDFPLGPLIERRDWAHMNSIRYTADNPVTHTPAFLISVRNISTVFIIDAQTGAIVWQSPKGMFSLQHDATFTEGGNILVFDNGLFRPIQKAVLISRVVEVNPSNNATVWQYVGGKSPLETVQFASSIMSGAQRLENGNTLITASMANTLLEVTPESEVVWKYTNDFRNEDGMRVMFKARKYDAIGTTWESFLPRFSLRACPR